MDSKYTYQEFKYILAEEVKKNFNNAADIEIHTIIKNNSLELEGMVIVEEGRNISPNFYLQFYYEDYLKGAEIVDIAKGMAEKHNKMQNNEFGSFSMDISNCIDKIVCRLVSCERNNKLLEEIPYIPFLDMAIIFYCLVTEDENGIGSVRISNSIMERWDMTIKTLYTIAIHNTERLFPKVFCPLKVMLKSILDSEGQDMPDIFENIENGCYKEEEAPFILTNRRGINGSAAILYPECLKNIGKMTETGVYIIPSSIHELLIIPDDGQISPDGLKQMVEEVNAGCVAADEVLSDMVYYYSVEKNIIEICS
ncbi:MAG: hypothetical protein HFH68_15815 [Lachnospiraceae bacterium]|nr:hypothetical protein [Lachnospiraceae bacterium]